MSSCACSGTGTSTASTSSPTRYQEQAGGIAEALGLAAHFAEGGPVLVMLADNILERSIRPMVDAFRADPVGARILLSKVDEPEHLRHLGVPVVRRRRPGGAHRGETRDIRPRTTA